MELLFGSMPDVARFVVAFMLVLGLIGAGALLWRRFGAGPLSPIGPRGRQPRLAVIDVASVDVRRRLVLIRRDNTEHLLMIGGPTDIVIEPNISRTATMPVSREPRPIPVGDGGRPMTSPEGLGWTLPMEPTARPSRTVEDVDAPSDMPQRTAREAMADSMRAVRSEPAARRSPGAELRVSLEGDESSAPAPTAAVSEPRRSPSPPPHPHHEPVLQATAPEAQRPAMPPEPISLSNDGAEPHRPAASSSRQPQSDENNLAEMAQRLEAALRRPTRPVDPAAPPPGPARLPARPEPSAARRAVRFETLNAPKGGIKSSEPPPSPPPDLKILPGKAKSEPPPPFESLEDEMAKMLGRSPGKS